MTLFYRNLIVGLFWVLITFLIIQSNTSQMLLAMLFTVFVLHFSQTHVSSNLNGSVRKGVSLALTISALSLVGWGLYMAFSVMIADFNAMINSSQDVIVDTMGKYGYEVNGLSEIYAMIMDFVKQNTVFLTGSATLVLKVILGVILGIILYFSPVKESSDNAWGSIMSTIANQCHAFYQSFTNIMGIQVLISIMNTTIIAILSTGITWLFFGEFLPYWYLLIGLTAILSLVPVIGGVLINIILALLTIQMSPLFMVFGLGLFFLMHKLEFLVIGKKMDEKVNIQISIILLSMVLGEMFFHSMSGMILGMVSLVTIAHLLRKMKVEDGGSLSKSEAVTKEA